MAPLVFPGIFLGSDSFGNFGCNRIAEFSIAARNDSFIPGTVLEMYRTCSSGDLNVLQGSPVLFGWSERLPVARQEHDRLVWAHHSSGPIKICFFDGKDSATINAVIKDRPHSAKQDG